MKNGLSKLALTLALAAAAAPTALAQVGDGSDQFVRNRFTAVQERPQPEFDPQPLMLGAFSVNTSVTAQARYNDNIFFQPNNKTEDTIIEIAPQADFRTNWAVHELSFGGSVDARGYTSHDEENSTDYSAYLRGRLDVTRNLALGAYANASHITEARYLPASQGGGPQAEYDRTMFEGYASFIRDRIQLDAHVGSQTDDFDLAQFDFRTSTTNYVTARGAFAISPAVAVFLQGRTADIEYDTVQVGFPSRDATQTNLQGGFDFELAAPFRGSIAIGYVQQDNDSPLRPDTDGLSADARLLWFPTELTTVTFTANRGVYDPGFADSSSALYSTYGAHVDHELRRNIILFGGFSAGKREYEFVSTANRSDDLFNADAGVAWKVNPHARVEAAYTFSKQDSDGLNTDVDNNTFAIKLRLTP